MPFSAILGTRPFRLRAVVHGSALLPVLIMTAAGSSRAGTYLLCGMALKVGTRRLILIAGVLGVLLQLLPCLSPGILGFAGLRMAQTALR